MERKILNFGSLNIDSVYKVPSIVSPGETISSINYSMFIGGKGLNQSLAISKAGTNVYHAGAVGETDGRILVDELNNGGVDTTFITRKCVPSGHAIIQVDENGQNSIILFNGANHEILVEEIDEVLSHFSKDDVLILQNEINNLEYIINSAFEKGMEIILNASPFTDELLRLPLEKISWFFVNEIEARQMCGLQNFNEEKIIAELTNKYPKSNFIITLGEKGSKCIFKNQIYSQPIYRASVVDTTAAGDTFTGYFISTYYRNNSIEIALQYASVAAAIAVSKNGASSSIPLVDEVLDFVKRVGNE